MKIIESLKSYVNFVTKNIMKENIQIRSDYKIIELNNEYEVEKRIYYVEDDVLVNLNRCALCGRKLK